MSLLAIIGGADSFVTSQWQGKRQQEFPKSIFELLNGIPSRDTTGRIFATLNPKDRKEAFREWITPVAQVTHGEVVAIDGKILRRSLRHAEDRAFVHRVSAWAPHRRIVLGQTAMDEKSCATAVIPRLLELTRIKGAAATPRSRTTHACCDPMPAIGSQFRFRTVRWVNK